MSINQSEGRFYAGSPGVEFRFDNLTDRPSNQPEVSLTCLLFLSINSPLLCRRS